MFESLTQSHVWMIPLIVALVDATFFFFTIKMPSSMKNVIDHVTYKPTPVPVH